jgi:hypothetical protein
MRSQQIPSTCPRTCPQPSRRDQAAPARRLPPAPGGNLGTVFRRTSVRLVGELTSPDPNAAQTALATRPLATSVMWHHNPARCVTAPGGALRFARVARLGSAVEKAASLNASLPPEAVGRWAVVNRTVTETWEQMS